MNPGFAEPSHALSYLLTQELLVPKRQAYKAILDHIVDKWGGRTEELSLLSPGIGVGDFETFVLESLPELPFARVTILGIDSSNAMTVVSLNRIARSLVLLARTTTNVVEAEILSGVNLVDSNSHCLRGILAAGRRFHCIIASQFEHYFPNDAESELAMTLRGLGVTPLEKHLFRGMMHEALVEGGIYFTIDDFLDSDPDRQRCREIAWDGDVLKKLTDERGLGRIAAESPEVERKIRALYVTGESNDVLLKRVGDVRRSRRKRCLEEITSLEETLTSLSVLFGQKNVTLRPNMFGRAHRNFFLAWGLRE